MADVGADLVLDTPGRRHRRDGPRRAGRRRAATWWARRRDPGRVGLACPACRRVRPARLVVLVSGAGTNLQALLDACADPAYGAQVVAVGADRDGIEGLARAERAGVPTFVHRVKDHADPRGLGRAR